MVDFFPRLVFSIHGIRTKANWQKLLSRILKKENIAYEPYNYGFYGLFKFLFRPSNESMVNKFYEFYSFTISKEKYQISLLSNFERPSIIVHSFGSYILGYCLLKNPDVKFDKIILCGSILPSDFDWATILLREQANAILNEYGVEDIWSKIVGKIVPKTGDSGATGFKVQSIQLLQKRYDYFKHSDYFRGQHISEFWLPFIKKQPCRFEIKHGHEFDSIDEFKRTLDITGNIIDKQCYGTLEHYPEVELPRGLSTTWIKVNPDIYTFIFDQLDNEVKGYINAIPIEDDAFEKIKNGSLNDNEISAENIVPFVRNQNIKIYLMSIAIAQESRAISEGLIHLAFEKLMNGFVNKLIYYFINNNIRVTQFLAVGWTSEGRKLCRLMGMQQVGIDHYSNPIYLFDLENESQLNNKMILECIKKLIITYKKFSNNNN